MDDLLWCALPVATLVLTLVATRGLGGLRGEDE